MNRETTETGIFKTMIHWIQSTIGRTIYRKLVHLSLILAAPGLLSISSCTAQIEDPFAVRIFQMSGREEVPVLIARDTDECVEVLEHRVYYWPYVLPISDWKSVQESLEAGGRYRYRTVLRTWDVLLLIPLGIMGFSSQTHVLEKCEHTELPVLYGTQRKTLAEYSVYFELNSFSVPEAEIRKIRKVAELWKRNPDFVFLLLGQTDQAGREGLNRSLSLQRAESVRDSLVSMGVPRANLRVAAAGSELSTSEQSESDRRVEMVLIVR